MAKVAGRVNFSIPSDNIEVIRHITELQGFGEIPRQKRNKDGDG